MRLASFVARVGTLLVAIAPLSLPRTAPGQALGSAKVDKEVQAIDDDYNRQLLRLDQRRLEQLGRLAGRQKPAEAAATYERLLRLAIAGDLFRDAEAAAGTVLEQGNPSATTNALAHLVKIIAEADRGAFDQSLRSLRKAVADSMQAQKATFDVHRSSTLPLAR